MLKAFSMAMGATFNSLSGRNHPFSGTNRACQTPMNMDPLAAAIGAGSDGSSDDYLTSSPANLTTGVFGKESKRIDSGSPAKSTVQRDFAKGVQIGLFVHCTASIYCHLKAACRVFISDIAALSMLNRC